VYVVQVTSSSDVVKDRRVYPFSSLLRPLLRLLCLFMKAKRRENGNRS
jgi:hypothetical protein